MQQKATVTSIYLRLLKRPTATPTNVKCPMVTPRNVRTYTDAIVKYY